MVSDDSSRSGRPIGGRFFVWSLTLSLVLASGAVERAVAQSIAPGYILELYEIGESMSWVPEIAPGQKPNVSRREQQINFDADPNNFAPLTNRFVGKLHGYLNIPRRGEYEFRVTSDDGSLFYVGGQLVVDHDGLHGSTKEAGTIELNKGPVPFVLHYFNAGGADKLVLEWRGPRTKKFEVCPPTLFFGPTDVDHSTTTGRKRIQPGKSLTPLSPDLERARAIDRGIAYLLDQLEQNPIPGNNHAVGQAALEAYALISSGISFEDERVKSSLDYVDREIMGEKNTYALSCAIFAHEAAWSQLEEDLALTEPGIDIDKHSSRIGRAQKTKIDKYASILIDAQNKTGAWRYTPSAQDADVSCSQFAVLALGLAAKRGFHVRPEVWREATKFFIGLQSPDGPKTDRRLTLTSEAEKNRLELVEKVSEEEAEAARGKGSSGASTRVRPELIDPVVGTEDRDVFSRPFGYTEIGDGSGTHRWNRTCAALSSLLVIRDRWKGRREPDVEAKLSAAIQDGYGWVMDNWAPYGCFYGIYSLEKVGDLGHVEKFGDVDWFEEASKWLVDHQGPRGQWPGTTMHGENTRCTTAFGLLVLSRATSLMTRKPGAAVIATGRKSLELREQERDERSWVYLPERETSVHFPSIVRTLRYRPTKALVGFLTEMVKHYRDGYGPETLPALLDIRNRVDRRAMKKALDQAIEEVCGRGFDDDEKALAWHARWTELRSALDVDKSKSTMTPERLVELYRRSDDGPVLRQLALLVSLRYQTREIIPHLIDDLGDRSSDWRATVYQTLDRFYPASLPVFEPNAPASDRERQIEAIRAFWKERTDR